MKRKAGFVVALMAALLFGALKLHEFSQPVKMPLEAQTVLRDGTHFTVLSLSPGEGDILGVPTNDPISFHGWRVLGQMPVNSRDQQRRLAESLIAATRGDIPIANCFWPRHGIRVEHAGKFHDFVICFECHYVSWFRDQGNAIHGAYGGCAVTSSPAGLFNDQLQAAGVPLPPK